jgi:hypothetical protein
MVVVWLEQRSTLNPLVPSIVVQPMRTCQQDARSDHDIEGPPRE